METINNLILGFGWAFTTTNLLYCFAGVFVGTIIGVLPGIGSIAAVSLLLPLSFYLEPATALMLLAGVYYGAEYGGSTASILLNLPGTPSSAVTCLDGYPMAKQGRAGVALFVTTIASFFGSVVGIMALILLSPLMTSLALRFGSAEYFAVMLLGLIAAATISKGSQIKSLAMVVLGLLLGCVGTDSNSGVMRYTVGFPFLFDGVNLIALAMGLFGVSEIINSIGIVKATAQLGKVTLRSMIPTWDDTRRSVAPAIRGATIGSIIGPLPGTGPTIASFLTYAFEKRLSRRPKMFGNGAIEGVAGPESANSAAVITAFIPTLTLGVPGSATMAFMLGALLIHGITPGPSLVAQHPDLFWGLIASFWIGNILLVFLHIPLIGIWVRLLQMPYDYLFPSIICLICIGVYSVNNSTFDVWLVLLFGAAGYAMSLMEFEPAPLIVGFILGPLMEENLRRALVLTGGDFMGLLYRPVSGSILILTMIMLLWAAYKYWAQQRLRGQNG